MLRLPAPAPHSQHAPAARRHGAASSLCSCPPCCRRVTHAAGTDAWRAAARRNRLVSRATPRKAVEQQPMALAGPALTPQQQHEKQQQQQQQQQAGESGAAGPSGPSAAAAAAPPAAAPAAAKSKSIAAIRERMRMRISHAPPAGTESVAPQLPWPLPAPPSPPPSPRAPPAAAPRGTAPRGRPRKQLSGFAAPRPLGSRTGSSSGLSESDSSGSGGRVRSFGGGEPEALQSEEGWSEWDEAAALEGIPADVAAAVRAAGLPPPVAAAVIRAMRCRRRRRMPQGANALGRALSRWAALTDAFGGPEGAAQLLSRRPDLFLYDPDMLASKIPAIQEMLHLPSRGAALRVAALMPTVLTRAPATLERRIKPLAQTLGVEEAAARALAAAHPSLLLLDTKELRQKLKVLAKSLAMAPSEAQALVLGLPVLLNLSVATLESKCTTLLALEGLAPTAALAVPRRMPGVLLLGSSKLRQRWDFLRAAAAACPRWSTELAALSPASLGILLTSSDCRLARLRFLHASGQSASVPLYRAVNMPTPGFEGRFSGYAAWSSGGGSSDDGGGGGGGGEASGEEGSVPVAAALATAAAASGVGAG